MVKSIAVIGTLDTKGDQIEYLKKLIEERGHEAIVIDVGVLGETPYQATITRQQVAQATGTSLQEIIAFNHEGKAMDKMTDGACNVVKELYCSGKLGGVLAVGGSMGTSLALRVMNVLPLGLPKLIMSTIAYSHAISPDLLCSDLMMMPWVGGLWGINEVAKRVLEQAAAIICAAAEVYDRERVTKKKLIGVTSLGMASSRYLHHLKPALEGRGYEVAVFHATGMSTRVLEKAIAEGSVDAVLDLQVGKELINQVCGSLFSPGPHRLEAAAERGIPQVVSPGNVEACLWATYKRLPRKFRNRLMFEHNPLLMVLSTNIEEKVAVAKLMAKKLNKAIGPTAVVIPTRGSAALIKSGLLDREGVQAFRDVLKRNLKPEIKVVELDLSYDDPGFSDEVVTLLDGMVRK